ncbi:hypothetical protein SCHPADRAFT_884404 [Schizopora paradoxa]|uniref:Uncharacterized protein n=1 Tax=Schizopora paradoxa TaxID=27342 RepID=A0A0H2ST43_9AGAM|nr:hypothetical protein SCHPADRAFT_884404 [Schizopora paradoxa]
MHTMDTLEERGSRQRFIVNNTQILAQDSEERVRGRKDKSGRTKSKCTGTIPDERSMARTRRPPASDAGGGKRNGVNGWRGPAAVNDGRGSVCGGQASYNARRRKRSASKDIHQPRPSPRIRATTAPAESEKRQIKWIMHLSAFHSPQQLTEVPLDTCIDWVGGEGEDEPKLKPACFAFSTRLIARIRLAGDLNRGHICRTQEVTDGRGERNLTQLARNPIRGDCWWSCKPHQTSHRSASFEYWKFSPRSGHGSGWVSASIFAYLTVDTTGSEAGVENGRRQSSSRADETMTGQMKMN